MIKELKELKKQLDSNGKKDLRHDEEGRITIDLHVRDDDGFLSPYSTENNSTISDGVSDFIEHSLKSVPIGERLHFNVYGNTITDDEKAEYTEALHSHYSVCYKDAVQEKKKLKVIAFIMSLIAIITLTVMIYLEVTGRASAVFTEIIDIVAWVFMWEAVDIFFFRCKSLQIKELRYLCLVDSKIDYYPEENNR